MFNFERNLEKKDRMFWNLAVTRGVYGFFGCIFSIYIRYFDPVILKDIVYAKTELSYLLNMSHLGFFLFEWTAQLYFDIRFKTFNKALHAHHLIALTGYILTAFKDTSIHFHLIVIS
jgi:hypothetical protein